jgi:hypothetical protein
MALESTIETSELRERAERIISNYCDLATDLRNSFSGEGNKSPEYYISAAISQEYRISFIIKELASRGEGVGDYIEWLSKISRKNRELFQEYDSDYRILSSILEDYVEQYSNIVCYIFELDPINIEADNKLLKRDEIEMIMDYLPRSENDPVLIGKVEALDKSLEHKFELMWEECLNSSGYISEPHYPDKYWWRHPEKQLSEYIEYYENSGGGI